MTRTLEDLDAIMHDVAQTHLEEYRAGSRGPYPGHPHGREESVGEEVSHSRPT